MKNKNEEPDWKNKLEDVFSSTEKETGKGNVARSYNFEREDKEYIYSCTVTVSEKKKPPENKFDELTELIQSLENENLTSLELLRSEKPKRISELVRELAAKYEYRLERKVGPDYHIYTRRIGDECDVLVDYWGKVAYTHLDLRRPFKHHYYGDIIKVLSQKKEIKKFGRTFEAVEENFYLGSLGQRLLSYATIALLSSVAGTAYGFDGISGHFLIYLAYGGVSTFLALGGIGINYLFHKRKVKKNFEGYAPGIAYNKEALDKAFSYKPSKSVLKEC